LRHRPHEVARVLVSAARTGKRREEIVAACERHRVPFEVVPERTLSEIAGPAHNGMAAEVKTSRTPGISERSSGSARGRGPARS
jgi:tRNA G18 (ribose-2'-O)-methylase SpoU